MKACKNCGQLNTNDCDFCCHCGNSDFVFQEEIVCTRCGASNDKSFDFCINCGSRLHTVDVATVAPYVTDAAQQNAPTATVNLQERDGGTSIANVSENAKCPRCGATVPIHAVYCLKCGENVGALHAHRVVKRKVCPHCGRLNSLDAQLCSYCFCTLAKSDTCEAQVVQHSKILGDSAIKQVLLESEQGKSKICTSCGTLNSLDEVFCVSCGLKLDAELQKKYCPNCGAENAVDVAFCTKCQWSFNGSTPGAVENWLCSKCQNTNDSKNGYCVVCGAKRNAKGRKK